MNSEVREKRRGENFIQLSDQQNGLGVSAFDESIHFDLIKFRIDNPVFLDSGTFIEFAFNNLIIFPCGGGKNFDDQIWRALDVMFCNDGLARLGDKENIWLNDVHLR